MSVAFARILAGVSMIILTVVPPSTASARSGPHGDPDPTDHRDTLQVSSVSPWVDANGTFEVAFSTAGLPPDAVVTTTIHQRLSRGDTTWREAFELRLDDRRPPRNLQAPVERPLAELPVRNGTATVGIPIRSGGGDSERQLVPTPGIHPVTIEVASPDDVEPTSATVFLNRLPDDPPTGRDAQPARTAVQLLAALDSAPALDMDGRSTLSTDESLAISSWESLLSANRDLPLTVALRPNTILALQRSDVPAERSFVEDLADTSFTFSTQTYVKVDTAALERSDATVLDRQIGLGSAILDSVTGGTPEGIWMFDDNVDRDAARHLAGLGVKHLFVSESRLALRSGAGSDDDEDRNDDDTAARERTFALEGVDGMTVSSYDAEVTRQLLDTDIPPGLRAHRGATALMASWFDAVRSGSEAFPGVSAAVVLAPGIDQDTLSALVAALRYRSRTAASSGYAPLALEAPGVATADDQGAESVARLRRRGTGDIDGVLRSWGQAAAGITGYASMTGPADPTIREWTLLNDQTLAVDSDAGGRSAIWGHIGTAIEERLAEIQSPPPRSVVLTSRSGTIPLRLRNRGDTPVTVRMTTRSPRLEFPEGAVRDIRLEPDENRLKIPVVVRAPGSSLLRIELTSPDGSLEIREVQVTVRSSSISGVGAALSIISLIVLALWWVHTLRRRHRVARPTSSDRPDDHG